MILIVRCLTKRYTSLCANAYEKKIISIYIAIINAFFTKKIYAQQNKYYDIKIYITADRKNMETDFHR